MFEAFVMYRSVRDAEKGIEIQVFGTPDYGGRAVIKLADGKSCDFYFQCDLKFPDRPFVLGDRSNPTIFLYTSEMEKLAKFRGSSIAENTKFVKLILEGLAAYNRLWPMMRTPVFYSDQEKHYQANKDKYSFVMPSEEELAKL